MTAGWTRREFLAAANATALLVLLESCIGPGATSTLAGQSSADLIKQALMTLRDALRASPDHLAYRAQAVAATRDSAKIAAFVRDAVAVVPAWGGNDDPSAVRWGGAAALRGGQGTLRERADILADLLTKASFKASVMAADRPAAIDVKALYHRRTPGFAPDSGKVAGARSLLRQAGLPAAAPQRPAGSASDPAAGILAALPAGLQHAAVRDDLLPDTVPVVHFTEGGKDRYAFALGDLGISDSAPGGLHPLGLAEDAPAVTVTVSALAEPALGSTTQGGRLIDLVSGTWRADKIVGRQVILTFSPLQGPKAALDSGLASLPVRVPFLRVQTASQTADPSLIAAGSMITVQGDVLGPAVGPAPSPGTPLQGPYGPYLSLSDSDRKAAEARVSAIKVAVNPAAFPEVELLMDVSDSTGASVDGLDARSFTVTDTGTAVGAIAVYSNARKVLRPRVLVVYDDFSGWWPNDGSKAQFESALASALVAQAAATPFDVQAVNMGADPSPDGWVAPDAGKLTAFFAASSEAADDPWATCGGAALDQAVSAIVCVSDFNNADGDPKKLPTFQHRLIAAGVPVLAIPVGQNQDQYDAATLASVVKLTAGQTFPATAAGVTAAATAVAGSLKGWVGSAYRLRYTAPSATPVQRTVSVGIAGRSQPQGQAPYQVPAQPVPPPSFAGLYVSIGVAGLFSVRRIAGVEVSDRGAPLTATGDAAAIAETRAAMDGVTTIAFEPGSPTSAAMLDDVVSSLLTVVPLAKLPASASSDQLLKAGQAGIRRVPVTLASLLRPTAVDPDAVAGLKVAILQDRPVSSTVIEQHADLAVGLNPVVPLASDPAAAFKAAVATSVAACAAEAATLPTSAYANLAGASLKPIAASDYAAREAWLTSQPPDQRAAWRPALVAYDGFHRLVPADGKAAALWVVDPGTGVAKAVLLDGTGGAMIRMSCHFDAFDQLAMTVAFLAVLCSFGGAELFPFWCVGINVLAVGLAVAAYFNVGGKKHNDTGTPFGMLLPFAGLGSAGFGGIEGSVGIMLMLITIQSACTEG